MAENQSPAGIPVGPPPAPPATVIVDKNATRDNSDEGVGVTATEWLTIGTMLLAAVLGLCCAHRYLLKLADCPERTFLRGSKVPSEAVPPERNAGVVS